MNSNVMRWFATVFAWAVIFWTRAELIPISPVDGTEIPTVTAEQRKMLSLPTHEARLDALKKLVRQKHGHSKSEWRKAPSFVLKFKTTAGEKGPWKVEIGKTTDLSDARVWYFPIDKEKKQVADTNGVHDIVLTIPRVNFEINTTYYWRVTCSLFTSAFEKKRSGKVSVTAIASFRTEDIAPRWIAIEGRVANMRDLGGRKTVEGKRVRQGLIYRGQGLNDNSVTGEARGKNRLTMNDVEYLQDTLGIKTDLDLRSRGEIADMTNSPLGNAVRFVHNSSSAYRGIFERKGMQTMAKNFRLFLNEANYPIYLHCIGGADRTGSLAYVLNGVLGVDRQGLETDWESTFYPNLPEMGKGYAQEGTNFWCGSWHFTNGFQKYGTATTDWNTRIKLYLLDCGITQEEIQKFQTIMLE